MARTKSNGNSAPSSASRDLHPDLRADYILPHPPFNDSDWFH